MRSPWARIPSSLLLTVGQRHENPGESNDAPEFPSFGDVCNACHRPDMSNMTWQDGVKYLFSTFCAAPRVWPVGYILNSSYSPLRLERDMPSKNWRDAFEDLLALEANNEMISDEHRRAENEVAAIERYTFANASMSMFGREMKKNSDFQSSTLDFRQGLLQKGDTEMVKQIDDRLLPILKKEYEKSTVEAQEVKKKFEEQRHANASSLKPRGQGIASLITSGALPDWHSDTSTSLDGTVMGFGKRDAPPDLDSSFSISELELQKVFEEGQDYSFGLPLPLPSKTVKTLTDGSIVYENAGGVADPYSHLGPNPTSPLSQRAYSEPIRLPNGSVGRKVILKNSLADGTTVTKEFEREPAKLLEEVETTRKRLRILCGATLDLVNGGEPPSELQQALEPIIDQILRVEVEHIAELEE